MITRKNTLRNFLKRHMCRKSYPVLLSESARADSTFVGGTIGFYVHVPSMILKEMHFCKYFPLSIKQIFLNLRLSKLHGYYL